MKDIEIYGRDLGDVLRKLAVDAGGRYRRSYYLRDITTTGSSTLTRSDQMEIIAGDSNNYLDLVTVAGSNTSTNAIRVDIRAGTSGATLDSMVIPSANVAVHTFEVPLPASEKDQNWNARVNQSGEISDSPVIITLIAVKNP